VLAQFEDTHTGQRYDVRQLFLDTENELVRLRKVADPFYEVLQYPSKSVTLKTNFELIARANSDNYKKLVLESRIVDEDLQSAVCDILNVVPDPIAPVYAPDAIFPSLLGSVMDVPQDVKEFFLGQWQSIEETYMDAIRRAFCMMNRAHSLMLGHLQRARSEIRQFLCRPGSSQHLVVEFQQWHCTQVERCMRRMQKVKDECALRLSALRESLIQIEVERKNEEQVKQKDLLNVPFRGTLFELVSNGCTLLAQAEIDRWTATRCLMLDFNQVISDCDLVPPLPRKKLNMIVDPSRAKGVKGAKKATRATPPARVRLDSRLAIFDCPLFEQLEAVKKYVADASVIYVKAATPVSTRAKPRPVKDKNPFAVHKVAALDEFAAAFVDDDVYLVSRLDQIASLAHEEIGVVQQAFDSYLDESGKWISTHFERRKSIADTAIAYMLQKVNDEAQLNHLVFLEEDQCVVDHTQLLIGNEEMPKIPAKFPDTLIEQATTQGAEVLFHGILDFEAEANQP
jgi:hypothetical protein